MRKFGRKKSNREHMMRNLLTSLVLYEQIETTSSKAKEVKASFDQIISRNKSGDFNAIRRLQKIFFDNNAVEKTIKELLPRYESRNSGYVRSYHLANRIGDNSEMIRLELVDRKIFVKDDKAVSPKTKRIKAGEELAETVNVVEKKND